MIYLKRLWMPMKILFNATKIPSLFTSCVLINVQATHGRADSIMVATINPELKMFVAFYPTDTRVTLNHGKIDKSMLVMLNGGIPFDCEIIEKNLPYKVPIHYYAQNNNARYLLF